MDLYAISDQVVELLRKRGRVAYRSLQVQFQLDDVQLDALKEEVLFAHPEITEEAGRGLVWGGQGVTTGTPTRPTEAVASPVSYTPRHLAERILAEQTAMEARGVTDGERKSITALFADIKGSTDLIAELDPEEARAILDPTLKLMIDAVHRYEGYVAQSLGDGIFALFGAPIAHEDHPQRALYAALKMQDDVRQYGDRLRQQGHAPLQIRVGINTGEVVLRSIRKDDLHTDYVPVGHSTNLASRMETLATPGSILVSEPTYKLTEGYFEFKALGQAQVKGFAEPLHIFEVTGVGPLRTKMQVAARRGLARFVGRQSEFAHLQKAMEATKAGHGQIVGVIGEPGVGKSRLFYEFKILSQHGCIVLETFSVSHGKAYPYLPLIDLLKSYFQLGPLDDERQRREKVTGRVLTLDRSLEDALPYVLFLLGIAEPTSPLQQMDPQIRRKRILDAIKRLLLRESLNQPVIVIFEDLHWLDAETHAFLQLLSESIPTSRLLLLVNYRPEYQQTWSGKTYFSQLRLDPLGNEHAEEMLSFLLGESVSSLPREDRNRGRVKTETLLPLKRFILEKTEGNPFFMEEIVQALIEQGVITRDRTRVHPSTSSGAVPLPQDVRIPATVQGVLTARIDRLPFEEKSLLQTLAVIGKEFSLSLLKHVAEQPEETLLRHLSHLQTSEFVYERPAFPDIEYTFKHALTQEVAYNSLLIERRKLVHERAANAIEELYRYTLEDRYSELAHHYSRSGNTQKAVDYLHVAGQQTVQRSANAEAISHFEAALSFLTALPQTVERDRQELALRLALGAQLIITKGYTAPEVGTMYTRAQELCLQDHASPHLFAAMLGLWTFSVVQAQYQTGLQSAQQLMHFAEHTQDPSLLLQAHEAFGWPLFWSGELTDAHEHVKLGAQLYDVKQHGSQAFRYWQDPGMACLVMDSWALWELGYPEQALQNATAALALVQDVSHAYSLAAGYAFVGFHYQLRRDAQATRDHTERAMALAREHGFPQVLDFATVFHGWALTQLGQQDGVHEIREGIAAWHASGAKAALTWYYAMLAEALGQADHPQEGLLALDNAFSHVQASNERFLEAELYRLKGELTLQQESKEQGARSREPDAEEYFLKAIDVAQKQQAKSLELRATMSLARLWQSQGKRYKAHQMLSKIYNWFTEGFDTKDLQEAQALLNELAEG